MSLMLAVREALEHILIAFGTLTLSHEPSRSIVSSSANAAAFRNRDRPFIHGDRQRANGGWQPGFAANVSAG